MKLLVGEDLRRCVEIRSRAYPDRPEAVMAEVLAFREEMIAKHGADADARMDMQFGILFTFAEARDVGIRNLRPAEIDPERLKDPPSLLSKVLGFFGL